MQQAIETLWENRAEISSNDNQARAQVQEVLEGIESGKHRVCEKTAEGWQVNQWVKKAVLLSFKFNANTMMEGHACTYDKVPLKFADWDAEKFAASGVRAVPGSVVRSYSYIAPGVVLMPSFVNIGAYVGEGTMVDTWATIGSCAQVGRNCHISGGAGLGGVLEPLQANPVIIEDNCFIGARSEVVEGMIVEEGAVLGMGVYLSPSTPIINRETGEKTFGRVPAYSVVLPGTLPGKPLPDGTPGPHMPCAIIIKTVDAQTRSKTGLNDLLRP